MEDHLTIDYQLLPIIENTDPEKFKDISWRTEYLCSRNRDYIITKDALLLDDYYIKSRITDFNYHGMIHIYSHDVEEEFKVKNTDGKLVSIVLITEYWDKHWRNEDLNDLED